MLVRTDGCECTQVIYFCHLIIALGKVLAFFSLSVLGSQTRALLGWAEREPCTKRKLARPQRKRRTRDRGAVWLVADTFDWPVDDNDEPTDATEAKKTYLVSTASADTS